MSAATFVDIAAIRTRLDGERELAYGERHSIEALAEAMPGPGAATVRQLLAAHDVRQAAKHAAMVAGLTAEAEREMAERDARRGAAWQRCPRRLAEAAVIASKFTPRDRDRDTWTAPPADDLPREMLRLALLTDEQVRQEPIPRLFDPATVAPYAGDAS